MLQNMIDYWYLYILLVVLIIVTFFVFRKAMRLSKKNHGEINALIEKARREKELRDAYSSLTPEIIANAPPASLFEGVALCLEAKCQKCDNTDEFYNSLSQPEKYVYSLYYLLSDARTDSLSAFFKASNRPLTSDAAQAAKAVFPGKIGDTVNAMFDCYDEENETASVIAETVDVLNEEYKSLTESTDTFAAAGEYIKESSTIFAEKH